MAAQYESFVLPLIVILSLPAGIFGAFLFLKLFGLANNIYAQVAFVMLIGLLGKNAVLIVEFAAQKHSQGASVLDAAMEGAAVRFRPILMTTLAALVGAIPLMLASGAGAELRQPLGIVMVGGLLLSQILTLFTTPVVYLFFDRLQQSFSQSDTDRLVADPVIANDAGRES